MLLSVKHPSKVILSTVVDGSAIAVNLPGVSGTFFERVFELFSKCHTMAEKFNAKLESMSEAIKNITFDFKVTFCLEEKEKKEKCCFHCVCWWK